MTEINNYHALVKLQSMNERNVELKSIRDTIDLYIEGIRTGNTEKLRDAFHPKAMMYGTGANTVAIVEIDGLYNFVNSNDPPSKTGEPHQCFVTSIHHAGNAAFVELIEESAFGHDYTNYFQLLKIDGQWKIVSKTYNTTTSNK